MTLSLEDIEKMDNITSLSANDISEMDAIFDGQGTEKSPFKLAVEKVAEPWVNYEKGLVQGLTSVPNAIAKKGANKLRPLIGKRPLTDEEFVQNYWVYDKPDTFTGKLGYTVGSFAPTLLLPELAAFKGAGVLPQLGNRALTGAYQGGLLGGADSLVNEGDLSNVGKGAGIGLATNVVIPPAIQKTAEGIENIINNPKFQKGTANTLEVLTSVPSKYSDLALKNELAGNSIFAGKFDPETAYIPIERKLREAKGMLPTTEDFAKSYRTLGKRALEGINELEQKASAEINEALSTLHNKKIKNQTPKNLADSVINSFGEGGVYNSARELAPGLVNQIESGLSKEGLTLMDLHRIKEGLYDIGYAAAKAKEGTKAQVARGVANQVNNYLRGVAPRYKAPNERYGLIQDIKNGLDGNTTIASKIRDIGQSNNILSGLDERLHDLDLFLPESNKFVKQAKEIANSEAEINAIKNTIGKQYERNPRLLSNRNDEVFEQALDDLQTKSGVNFMDDLNKTRAREALENIFPGQGGGSGSAQGFGNLVRTSIIGGVPTAAVLTRNPASLLGLGAVSPKFMAQGTIKNLGRLNNAAKDLQQNIKTNVVPYIYGLKKMFDRD